LGDGRNCVQAAAITAAMIPERLFAAPKTPENTRKQIRKIPDTREISMI
jgi:hypothetical protein